VAEDHQFTRYGTIVLSVSRVSRGQLPVQGPGGLQVRATIRDRCFYFLTILTLTPGPPSSCGWASKSPSVGFGQRQSRSSSSRPSVAFPRVGRDLQLRQERAHPANHHVVLVAILLGSSPPSLLRARPAAHSGAVANGWWARRPTGQSPTCPSDQYLGVIPDLASSLLMFPATIANFVPGGYSTRCRSSCATTLGSTNASYVLLIIFSAISTPRLPSTGRRGRQYEEVRGYIPGIRPARAPPSTSTASCAHPPSGRALHLDRVRAADLLMTKFDAPQALASFFGGTSI